MLAQKARVDLRPSASGFVRVCAKAGLIAIERMSDASKVLVTGVAGFIGSHVARVALLSGLAVRGTVRGKSYGIEEAVPGVELVEVDLLSSSEEDLVQALTGCDFLAHVASPFPGASVGDEEMQTAVEGTARMLRAAKKAGVTRVVLTSSVAAIGGGADAAKGTAARPYTSADWSPEAMASSYAVSKTAAEKGAWALASELGLEMTTIHPSFVNGPLLLPRAPTSTAMAKRILEGAMPAVPAIGMNVVGVNDVAEAHVKALLAPETAGQRLIVAAGNLLMTDLAVAMKAAHAADGWPIKTTPIPWVGMWLYSFVDKQAAAVLPMWRKETHYDCAATEKLLGRPLQPPMEAALAMARSLVDLGVAVKKRRGKKDES